MLVEGPLRQNVRFVEFDAFAPSSHAQHLQKLGPTTFHLWATIMQRTPGSKLWLLRFPREAEVHLKREASEHGVDQERVTFTGKFADDEHLKAKRGASMLLDTLEYNAHVSGLDALWIGLPMVTLPGTDYSPPMMIHRLQDATNPRLFLFRDAVPEAPPYLQ